jgi:hypothetical protein
MRRKQLFHHRHKFNATKTTTDGIKFDSKKEANYYIQLKLRVRQGEIVFFLRQVPFDLPGNVKYRVDFQEFHADGTIKFVDVKGMQTPDFIMKKKQVESLYPVEIELA